MKRLLPLAVLFLPLAIRADEVKPPAQTAMRSEKAGLSYLLYLPPGYEKSRKRFPLILFLHGSGERGDDLEKVKAHGPPSIVEKKPGFGFVVVSPQAPVRGWNPDQLLKLLDDVERNYRVDTDRVYLTGLSMGGTGTWDTAAAAPERFAAIAPVCGRGDPATAAKLADVPIWIFHGAQDTVVPVKLSEDMAKALKAAGNAVKLTVYPDLDHDSWTVTYDNPQLYEWFLGKHKRN